MKVVLPAGLRYAICGALGLAVLGGFRGVVPTGAPLATFASHRHWAAPASLVLAALWIFNGALVVIADRRHDERVARSADQRADPTSVPYVPPVSEYGAGPAGRPARIGWIFRTAGLFTLVLTGAIFVLVGLQSFTSHVLSSGLWMVIGASLEIVVVRAVVRRRARSRRGESPSSPIHDEVPLARL